eukprot:8749950-Alexandrium_andersonii.AAC.1
MRRTHTYVRVGIETPDFIHPPRSPPEFPGAVGSRPELSETLRRPSTGGLSLIHISEPTRLALI